MTEEGWTIPRWRYVKERYSFDDIHEFLLFLGKADESVSKWNNIRDKILAESLDSVNIKVKEYFT